MAESEGCAGGKNCARLAHVAAGICTPLIFQGWVQTISAQIYDGELCLLLAALILVSFGFKKITGR